ncbi:hypothetical protein ACWD1Y_05730 [Streptomyces sp. NPDC002814]
MAAVVRTVPPGPTAAPPAARSARPARARGGSLPLLSGDWSWCGASAEGPLETIALLVSHSSQATIEAVYRQQLRPVITKCTEAMYEIYDGDQERDDEKANAVS